MPSQAQNSEEILATLLGLMHIVQYAGACVQAAHVRATTSGNLASLIEQAYPSSTPSPVVSSVGSPEISVPEVEAVPSLQLEPENPTGDVDMDLGDGDESRAEMANGLTSSAVHNNDAGSPGAAPQGVRAIQTRPRSRYNQKKDAILETARNNPDDAAAQQLAENERHRREVEKARKKRARLARQQRNNEARQAKRDQRKDDGQDPAVA